MKEIELVDTKIEELEKQKKEIKKEIAREKAISELKRGQRFRCIVEPYVGSKWVLSCIGGKFILVGYWGTEYENIAGNIWSFGGPNPIDAFGAGLHQFTKI